MAYAACLLCALAGLAGRVLRLACALLVRSLCCCASFVAALHEQCRDSCLLAAGPAGLPQDFKQPGEGPKYP